MSHNSTHPRDHVACPECDATKPLWEKNRRLPQIGQTYECAACGHEVYVYDAGNPGETILQWRPVTKSMVENLLFFDSVGDWPDSELEDLFKQGLERREAIDYHITEVEGVSQSEWARELEIRGQQAVSNNVRRARERLDSSK